MENKETLAGGIILILFFVWIFSGYFSSTKTVVAYTATCAPASALVNGVCNAKSFPSVKTYFSVNKDQQTVISHTNQSGDTPVKYKNCTVVDEKNWTCEYQYNQSGSPDLGFSNGNFTTLGKLAESDKELGIYYVSSFHWWLLDFGIGGGEVTSQTTTTSHINTISPATDANNISDKDPFPFSNNECDANACPQYDWYDRHNVPMSNRCYTGMTSPCSEQQWESALGHPLTIQEKQAIGIQ